MVVAPAVAAAIRGDRPSTRGLKEELQSRFSRARQYRHTPARQRSSMKSSALFILFFLTLAAGARWQVAELHREQAQAIARIGAPMESPAENRPRLDVDSGSLQTVSFVAR